MEQKIKILWVGDSLKKINNIYETTLRLIKESNEYGFENWYCNSRYIRFENGQLFFRVRKVMKMNKTTTNKYDLKLSYPVNLTLHSFHKILIRCDLPFDVKYTNTLQLINFEAIRLNKENDIVNNITPLLLYNSKILGNYLIKYTPNGIIASSWSDLKLFGVNNKVTIAKSLNEGASRNVNILKWNESGLRKVRIKLKKMTYGFHQPILLQEYLDVQKFGELRIWFLNGEILCVGKKVLRTNDFRFKLENGDYLTRHVLTKNDLELAADISSLLKQTNLSLAAIDIICGKITDFNIASPGLLVEMEELWNTNFAQKIIKELF